ncbi:MAG: ABC transporter permease [Brevinema sp.]
MISVINRFFKDLHRYKSYIYYYVKALEKSRVSNTSLGYLWWFLDPLLNMAIYIIMVRIVFGQRDANYPIFFFSAMLVWRYFSMAVQQSASSITDNIQMCKDNYIPKFIFPLAICISSLTPFLFSLVFLFILMIAFQVSITLNLLYLPILLISLFLLTWTVSIICAHINVFMNDFGNILPHIIMVGMFSTPIFYDISSIPEKYIFFMKLNPVGIITTSFRDIFTYGVAPPTKQLIYMIIVTIIFLIYSIYLLYKYDQIYNKVSR